MAIREDLISLGLPIPDSLPLDLWAERLGANPCRNTLALVGLSALLFYAAERDHNPKVNDLYDAAIYTSTCLSVGYGDIFAKTPLGKILGTILMSIGPSLASKTADGANKGVTQQQILQTLQQILEKLSTPEPTVPA